MAEKRSHIAGFGTERVPWLCTERLGGVIPLITLVALAVGMQTCLVASDTRPSFKSAAPEHPTTIEDFLKEVQALKQDVGQKQAKTTLGGVGMATLTAGAGTILDAEIEELARGLRYDPGLIYRFVHDHVQFYPMWGDVKGAAMTLMDRSGNGFDQASLTVALLEKAAGQPEAHHAITNVRYIVGVIDLNAAQITNWLGLPNDYVVVATVLGLGGIPYYFWANPDGTINHLQMAHVWVKATIDNQPYEFDCSFKSHVIKSGLTESQLASAMGYSQSAFLSAAQQGATIDANYVKDLNRPNVTSSLTTYSTNLVTYIRTNYPVGDLTDVLGGKIITPAPENALPPGTPPYTVISRDYEFAMGAIPSGWKTWLRITHGGLDGWLSSSAIYGRRLVIKYDQWNRTQILLDGTILATGNVMTPGYDYPLTLEVDHPYDFADQSRTTFLRTGGIYNIINGWGDVGPQVIERHRQILQRSRHSGSADSSEEVLGESLALMGFTWMAQYCRTDSLLGQIAECTVINHHCVGIAGQYAAPYVDMPVVFVSTPSRVRSDEAGLAVFLTGGSQGSAYEYGVLEQLQDCNAVSAVKLLDIANDRTTEDKIFAATAANWAAIEPQLVGYDLSTKSQIYDYVQAGYTVDLPQYGALGEGDWAGAGYLATDVDDPGSFSAAYIISGGYDGGYSSVMVAASIEDLLAQIIRQYDSSSSHPWSSEPIDLVTGAYIYDRTDLTIGNGDFPFGLSFARQYNSQHSLDDGPLGLGWTHRLDMVAKVTSDGFQAMGSDSPVDAAASVVALYIAFDLFRSPSLVNNVVACLSQKWLMDQMIDNAVVIRQGHDAMQFIKLPDGSYNAPPGKAAKLLTGLYGALLLKDNAGNFLDFDPNGRAVQWSDSHGNIVHFMYADGKLSLVASWIGGTTARLLSFFYYDVNDPNHISSVADSAGGRSIFFGYDVAGNLRSYTDPEANVTTYEYDPNNDGEMTKVFYPTGPTSPFVTNKYDSLGRVKRQINATNDPNNAYDYCYAYYRTEELEPPQMPPSGPAARYSKVYAFDDHGSTVSVTDELGRRTTTEYDGHQRPRKVTSPSGNYTEYAYDRNHNIVQITRVAAPGHSAPNLVESNAYSSYEKYAGRWPWFTDLVRHTDSAGNITSYTYDYNDVPFYGTEVGNLRKITYPQVLDPNGTPATPMVELTYNAYGQVLTRTDPEGNITAYEYYTPGEGAGLKKTIIDPNGLSIATELTYDAVGNVATTKDPRGNTTTNEYYASRRLKKSIAPPPFGYETAYEYDADGRLRYVRQSAGNSGGTGNGNNFSSDPNCVALWRFEDGALTADSKGTNTLVSGGGESAETTDYREGTACLDVTGGTNDYLYCADANLDSGFPGKSGESNATFSMCCWVRFSALPATQHSYVAGKYKMGDSAQSYALDAYRSLEGKVYLSLAWGNEGGATGIIWRHYSEISAGVWYHVGITYNDSTRAFRIRIWDDTAGAILGTDRTWTTQNAMNIETAPFVVGDRGDMDATYEAEALIDELVVFSDVLSIDEIDQIRQGDYSVVEPQMTILQEITYNSRGQKESVRGPYPEGGTPEELQINYTQYAYDSMERLWKVTDAENNTTETRYHPDGQVWRVIDAEDHNAVTSTYYEDGTLASVADAKSNLTEYEYDGHVRPWKTTYADDTYEQLTYDDAGRLQQKRTRAGQNITFAYDALNRITERALPTKAIGYVYDLAGRLVDANDSMAGVFHHVYDHAGRLLSMTDPDSRTVSYQYDNAGNRTRLTYPDANYITYDYDELNRLTAVRDSNSVALASYTYDDRSRRIGLDYANGTGIGYSYDVAGRLLDLDNQTANGQHTYSYTYDDVGNRLSMAVTDSGGTGMHAYGYDKIYQLTDVNYPPEYGYLATDTTFAYDAAGNRTDVNDANGVCTYTTNDLNQYTAAGGVSYAYDNNGNMTNDGTNTYSYDAENRLLTVTKIPEPLGGACDNGRLTFTTGGAANWFAQTSQSHYGGDAAQSGAIGHSQESWLQTTVSGAGTLVFWWKVSSQNNKDWLEFYLDDVLQSGRISGNVDWQQKSYDITGAELHTLRWRYVKDGSKVGGNDCGWVDDVQWSGSYPAGVWETIIYTYDAAGRRVAKAVDGQTTTRYVYDGDQCIVEYDGSNQLLRKYLYGPGIDQPICMVEAAGSYAGTYYYHFDGLGSVVALTDDSGDAVEFYEYSVYGQVAAWDANHPNRSMFTGREYDKETGLYYYRARYYNPQIGRFLQTDPVGYRAGINLYAYCNNDPIDLVDPSGEWFETVWDIANVVMGGASFVSNMWQGNYGWAAADAAGLVYDVVATAVPFLPGGAAAAYKAKRAGNTIVESFDVMIDVANIARRTDRAAGVVDSASDAMAYGRRVHNEVGRAMEEAGTWNLDNYARIGKANQRTGPRPDFPGVDIWADITTPGQWERHVSRYSNAFGEGIPILYRRGEGVVNMTHLYPGAGTVAIAELLGDLK